jgi:hypothetical protein
LKDVDISYNVIGFNGSLLKANEFRKDAGPEVDAAWESLGVNCRYREGCALLENSLTAFFQQIKA